MNRKLKFFIRNSSFLIVFILLIIPVVSFGDQTPNPGLVNCGKENSDPCDFGDFMLLVDTIIKFILYKMVIPIAAIMFAYAGFELVSSGGSTEKRGIAKKIFTNTVIGLIIVVAAWLIIKTILSILGYQGAWIGF